MRGTGSGFMTNHADSLLGTIASLDTGPSGRGPDEDTNDAAPVWSDTFAGRGPQ